MMMMMRREALLALAFVGSVACAGARQGSASAILPDGLYRFDEHPQGVRMPFTGTIRVMGDSAVIVESNPTCRAERMTEPQTVGFSCVDFGIHGSRRTGHWVFDYTGTREVRTSKTVCAVYETKNGKQVCARTKNETNVENVPLRATLRLTPLTAPAGDSNPERLDDR
jgi:hypothetical protein